MHTNILNEVEELTRQLAQATKIRSELLDMINQKIAPKWIGDPAAFLSAVVMISRANYTPTIDYNPETRIGKVRVWWGSGRDVEDEEYIVYNLEDVSKLITPKIGEAIWKAQVTNNNTKLGYTEFWEEQYATKSKLDLLHLLRTSAYPNCLHLVAIPEVNVFDVLVLQVA